MEEMTKILAHSKLNKKILELGIDVFCYVLAEMIEVSYFEGCAILRDCLIEFEKEYKINTCRENVIQWRNGITDKRERDLIEKSNEARAAIFDYLKENGLLKQTI